MTSFLGLMMASSGVMGGHFLKSGFIKIMPSFLGLMMGSSGVMGGHFLKSVFLKNLPIFLYQILIILASKQEV